MLFFLSSAGTLSLTKWEEENLAHSLSGLGFTVVLLLPLSLTVGLMLPFMNNIAGNIYQIATPALIFARDLFARILFFLFKRGNLVQDRGTTSTTVNNTQDSLSSQASNVPVWLEYIFKIIGWFVLIVIFIIVVFLMLYLLKRILLKLLKVEKASLERGHPKSWLSWLKSMLNSFKQYWHKVGINIFLFLPRKIGVYQAYNALLYWGASRKYPREKQETPYEYCQRLSVCFPQQETNLEVITANQP